MSTFSFCAMRHPTAFRSPFKTARQVRELNEQHLAEGHYSKPMPDGRTTRKQAFEAGRRLLRGGDARINLRCIYRWKLASYIRRFEWVRSFPNHVPHHDLVKAVSCARKAARHPADEKSVRAALEAFDHIRSVGVRVASAFLTAMNPRSFTVTDVRAYRALGQKNFRGGIGEYLDYLKFCRGDAARLPVTLGNYDRALWQLGGRRTKRKPCH